MEHFDMNWSGIEPTPLTEEQRCDNCNWYKGNTVTAWDSGYCTAHGAQYEFVVVRNFGCRAWELEYPELDGTDECIVGLMQDYVETMTDIDGKAEETIGSVLLFDRPNWTMEQLRKRCGFSPLLDVILEIYVDYKQLSRASLAGPPEWERTVTVYAGLPNWKPNQPPLNILLDETVDELPVITKPLLAVARLARSAR